MTLIKDNLTFSLNLKLYVGKPVHIWVLLQNTKQDTQGWTCRINYKVTLVYYLFNPLNNCKNYIHH